MTLPVFEDPIPTDTPSKRRHAAALQLEGLYLAQALSRVRGEVRGLRREDRGDDVQRHRPRSSGRCRPVRSQPTSSSPTHHQIAKLSIAQLIRPLNHELLPNLATYSWPSSRNPFYDQGWRYTVPYTIYTTGIAYRRDHIPDDEIRGLRRTRTRSSGTPSTQGKVTIYDDYRETTRDVASSRTASPTSTPKIPRISR